MGCQGLMLFGTPPPHGGETHDTQKLSLPDYGLVAFEVERSVGAG